LVGVVLMAQFEDLDIVTSYCVAGRVESHKVGVEGQGEGVEAVTRDAAECAEP
jgi:hypothetical protein